MEVTVSGQERADVARRQLKLEGAPTLSYTHERYSFRKEASTSEHRTWQPDRMSITWRQGILHGFALHGHRLKKDGTVGALAESIHYSLDRETGTWTGCEEYGEPQCEAPGWVLRIIHQHRGDVPPFNAPR